MSNFSISQRLINLDNTLNAIPLVRIPVSLVNLFEKAVLKTGCVPKKLQETRYIHHIKNKNVYKSIALLIPGIGDLVVLRSYLLRKNAIKEVNVWNAPDVVQMYPSDKDVVLAAVSKNGYSLVHADDFIKDDQEVVSKAIEKEGDAIQYASKRLQNVLELKKAAFLSNPTSIEFLENFDPDRKDVLEVVKKNWSKYLLLPEKFQKDKEIALAAFPNRSSFDEDMFIEHLPDELKKDPSFVYEALQLFESIYSINPHLFTQASDWTEKASVIKIIDKKFSVFASLSEDFRKDKDVVLTAVKNHGGSIRNAIGEVRKDPEVIEAALQADKGALSKSCEDILDVVHQNKDLFMLYAEHKWVDFAKLSDAIKNDRKCMLLLAKNNSDDFGKIPEKFKCNKEFIKEFIKEFFYLGKLPRWLKDLPEEFKNDKELMTEFMKISLSVRFFAGDELRKDSEFMLNALQRVKDTNYWNSNVKAKNLIQTMALVSDALKDDFKFMLEAVKIDKNFGIYASEKAKKDASEKAKKDLALL